MCVGAERGLAVADTTQTPGPDGASGEERSQARRDALADAETLRLNVAGLWCKTKRQRDLRADLKDADAWGVMAWRSQSDHCARQAARAAFRAVPGLRE